MNIWRAIHESKKLGYWLCAKLLNSDRFTMLIELAKHLQWSRVMHSQKFGCTSMLCMHTFRNAVSMLNIKQNQVFLVKLFTDELGIITTLELMIATECVYTKTLSCLIACTIGLPLCVRRWTVWQWHAMKNAKHRTTFVNEISFYLGTALMLARQL